jgi:hypothetical protein
MEMENKYTNIELIAILTKFKKDKKIKIANIQKMKKEELINLCKKHELFNNELHNENNNITIENLSKKQMRQDIEIFFIKQNKTIDNIEKIPKKGLIEIMEENNIPHLTEEQLVKEYEYNTKINQLKDIIKYNYIKFGVINIAEYNFDEMNIEELENFIKINNLITDISDYYYINELSNNLISVYSQYCRNINKNIDINKRNIPYLLEKIKSITL